MLEAPKLNAVLKVGYHKRSVEGENDVVWSARYASLDAAQDTIGFLGCKHIWLGHTPFCILRFSSTDTSKSFFTELLFIHSSSSLYECLRFPHCRCRTIAVGVLSLMNCMGPGLSVWHPLSPVWQLHHCLALSTNLLSALNPTVHVIDVKQ